MAPVSRAKPREMRVRETIDRVDQDVAAIIPVRQLQKARREPKWLTFRKTAIAERKQLREKRRSG
jgi:hypothetical protein